MNIPSLTKPLANMKEINSGLISFKALIFLLVLIALSTITFAQSAGDYQTNAAGAWNWSTVANWQRYNGSAWVAAPDYPGQNSGTGTVTILNNITLTLDVSPANAIGALSFASGTTLATTLTFSGTNSLTVTGAISYTIPAANAGDQTIAVGAGILNCASLTMPETGNNNYVENLSLSTGTITVSGNITMQTATAARNVITLTGAGTINVGGSFTGTGTFTCGTGTVNYNGTGAQNVGNYTYNNLTFTNNSIKTLQGNASTGGALTINANATFSLGTTAATFSVAGTSTISGTLDFGNTSTKTVTLTGALSGAGTIDMSTGSLLHVLNLGGATNNIGTLTTAAVASAINYNRAGDQTIFTSPNYRNLSVSNGFNKSLQGNIAVGGVLTLSNTSNAKIILGPYDLTLTVTATVGTPTATSYISADGSGQLKKVFAAGATAAYVLPVGDLTGTAEYSPVSLNFTANSTQRTIGVKVVDAQHPNDGTINNYITRYWSFTDDQAGVGTYTYTALFTHVGAPADLVGANNSMRVNRWDGTWTQYTSTWPSGTSIQASGLTETTAPLNGSSFTGRVNPITTYTWNKIGLTASWADPFSWTPTRLSPQPEDVLIFDNAGTTTATNVPFQTIGQLILKNNSNVSLQSAAAGQTLTISGGSNPTDLDIPVGSTLQISSTGGNQLGIAFAPATQDVLILGTLTISGNVANSFAAANSATIVNGTINNGGTITSTAGNLTFNSGSIYNHTMDAGALPTASWNVSSTINVTGTTVTAPTGLINQTFGNLNFNCAALTGARTATLTGAVIVAGNLSIAGTSAANTMTLQLANQNFTVNGTTNINAFGILNDNNNAGANLFIGQVAVNNNGVWTISAPATNPPFTFRGGLVNYGTMSATGTGAYTFDTNPQYIEGTQAITINNLVTTGITLTNRNTSSLTAGTITGSGNFVNGDVGYNAILTLTGGAPNPFGVGVTLNLSSNPNTVNFNGAAAQTIGAYNFYNLTSSSTGGRTLANTGTIGISGTFTPGTNAYTTTGSTIDFNGTSAQNIPAFTFNNLTVSGNSIKTLTGNVTVGSAAAGVLNLNNAILELAGFNLTFLNTSANPFTGTFNSTSMISTNGTGYVQRNGSAAALYQITYPVGSGGYYSPMTISSIAAAFPTYIRVRTVPTAINPSYIKKYWDIQSSIASLTNVTATFQYDPAELNGASPSISYSPNSGTTWQNPPASGSPSYGPNSFTISGNTPFSGWWTMGYKSYYSYQTGDWNNPTTWTSDPSGTLQIGTTIPGVNDNVIILTGRTVSLSSNISTANLNLTIIDGGFLDLATYQFTQPLQTLTGQGTLKLASTNFPTGATATFTAAGGGTVEYNNTANFTLPTTQTAYNNLTINTSPGIIATQLSNITLNSNLYVKQGTYRINDDVSATKLSLTINGNLSVDNGGFITVGRGTTNTTTNPNGIIGGAAPFLNYYNHFHTLIIKGDFSNNGIVRFTNLVNPVFDAFPPLGSVATSGAVSVYFQGAADNTLTCEGQTDFYNLIVDKGTDQTFKLTINSSVYSNFRLFGANVSAGENDNINPDLKKALWIRTGTLVLTGFVVIPSLTEGTTVTAPSSDFTIPANACLTLDGANVVVLSTADDYRDVNVSYGLSGGSGLVNGVSQGGYSGLKVLGKLVVNDGYLSTRESAGLLYSNLYSGQIYINGGVVDVKQFDGNAGGLISYTQTDGQLTIRGRLQRMPSSYSAVSDLVNAPLNTARANEGTLDAIAGSFSINSATNVFTMSSGKILINDATSVAGRVYDVLSSASNFNVTGGTIELAPVTGTVTADAPAWLISSNAPIGNLLINRLSGSSTSRLNSAFPLTVLKNVTVQVGDLEGNGQDLTIGGNFTIQNGTSYTPGANTTTFNGQGTQVFSINTASPLSLYRLTINKVAGDALNFSGTQNTINVTDNFRLALGTLNDNGNTINVYRDVFNSGVHSGTGKLAFIGTVAQAIDGNGTFGNVDLNNNTAVNAPVSLVDNMTINGVLTFSRDKLFNIDIYNLKLNAGASLVSSNGSFTSRYIQCSGNAGDGGVTKVYSSTNPFVFPLGAPTINPVRAVKYTPATIGFSIAPTTYGSITVIPVGYEHPSTTVNGQSLTYFWRIKSSNFAGIPANSVTHTFVYDQSDVVGTEGNYIPTLYNRSTYSWNNGVSGSINTGTNTISDWASPTNSNAFLDGDYTAGDASFGSPTKFYSIASGAWNLNTTWSNTSGGPAVPAGVVAGVNFPGPNSIVIIENNRTVNLTATQNCASLQIQAGSVLDIFTWTNSTFGMVLNHPSGNGLFRLTTTVTPVNVPKVFSFPPNSDFSDFNNNGGTTEYYDIDGTAGALYILPSNVTTYGNLMLTARGGDNLVLPNNALTTIKGNLTCGGDNPNAWIAASWNTTNYYGSGIYNPTIEKTVHIMGNMIVNTGTFIFMREAVPQHIIVDGNLIVNAGAWIDLEPTGTNCPNSGPVANTFAIGGNLVNNTTSAPNIRFLNGAFFCDVTFQGSNNASITGTAATTTFNRVTVNKGNSQATTLTLSIGGTLSTPVDNWLTLQNGTFRYMRTDPNSDFTISQGTAVTIPSTAGLYIDYSNSGNRNILIANAASGTNDLFLNGKLTLIRGNVYVGPIAAPNNDNDIEYSGGGASSIEVQGGQLVVNGQIRRNVASTGGILSYTQSGGTVTINGNNSNATRAKLEVLNTGSLFNMTNGTLTIVRGGGTTFGDLYLRPATGSITGGSIIFTQGAIDAVQNYSLESNFSLNNLTITGKTAGTPRNATVTLMVNPLTVNGNLTLSNTNSILTSNNRNITVNGGFSNSGTYNFGTNTTTFSGGTQTITGASVTNFYDLVVSPVTSLTPNNSFTVNRNLNINNGILILGNKKVTVLGSLTNNGTYTDDNLTGGISLNGTAQQQVSGMGAYGRLELNNSKGAKTNNSISLNGNLDMTLGIMDINQYQLTLGQNSLINGGPFSLTKMIVSDGVATSEGLRKFFNPIAATTNFTFPVGVTGKYTPADFTINTNATTGSITVIPTNISHPAVVDPLNVLGYYWRILSSGVSNFDSKILLQYTPGDVKVNGLNTEADYVAAELISPGTYWSKANPGPTTDNVDESLHQITFNYGSGTNNISGDYTAGINAALPDEVPTYTTNKNGNWSDETIWDPVGAAPPCPVGGPNGFNVVIDHIVTTNVNYCFAYQTTINSTLRIVSPTFGHNLGTVIGSGTIFLEGPNLPAGTFNDFLSCESGGTIEYGGSGNYTIIASLYDAVPNLFFTGSGTRTLPNKDLTICNRLKIDGPTLDNSISNRKLTILGTMERYNTGAFRCGSGANAIVSFAGTAAQTIGGPLGDFFGINGFNHLEINNLLGLNIGNNGTVQLSGNLLLTNGNINTSTTNRMYLNGPSVAIPAGGSSTSFVKGPLYKYIFSGSNFLYPIGKGTQKSHNFTVTNTTASSLFWMVEFFTPNPTYASKTLPIEATNTKEYWSVSNTSGSNTAKVKIGWDPASDLTPSMTINGLIDMRVAEYSGGSWIEKTSTSTGGVNNGDVATTNNLTISTTPINYTTASVTTTKPKASLSPAGPVCGAIGIPVTFSVFTPINLNYTLDYTIDGIAQPTITITSLPYTLPTPVAGAYKLTGFTYNNGAGIGVVNPTVVNAYAIPPTANAGPDQPLCTVSGVTLAGNDPTPYSGVWTKVSGIGGTILSPTAYNSGFNGTLGNTYTLRWTISNNTCKSYDDVIIAFNVAPQRPSNFTAAPTPVCQSSSKVYTVPNIPTATFNWSYTGSGASIGGTPLPINGLTNSVTINFSNTATSGTLSVTATNACGTSIARSVAITILTKPTINLGANPSVCRGSTTASLSYSATTGSPDQYSIVFDATAIAAGFANVTNATLPVSQISIAVPAGAAAAMYNASLTIRNSVAGCLSDSYPITVTVKPLPTITLGSIPPVCFGTTTTSLNYSATTNSPNLYSIDFDAAAEGQGFVDVANVALPASPITITVPTSPIVSTYNATLTVTNSITGCTSIGSNITLTILPRPTSTVIGLTAPLISPICEGQNVAIDILLTGQPNFTFTVQDDHGNSWNSPPVNVPSGSTYSFAIPDTPVVIGAGASTTYVYTVTNLVDGNVCSESAPAGSATIQVFVLPKTGPQYHITNSFGY